MQDMTLKEMFEVRDALELLVRYGYELQDMVDAIKQDIAIEVERQHAGT